MIRKVVFLLLVDRLTFAGKMIVCRKLTQYEPPGPWVDIQMDVGLMKIEGAERIIIRSNYFGQEKGVISQGHALSRNLLYRELTPAPHFWRTVYSAVVPTQAYNAGCDDFTINVLKGLKGNVLELRTGAEATEAIMHVPAKGNFIPPIPQELYDEAVCLSQTLTAGWVNCCMRSGKILGADDLLVI